MPLQPILFSYLPGAQQPIASVCTINQPDIAGKKREEGEGEKEKMNEKEREGGREKEKEGKKERKKDYYHMVKRYVSN